jgi:hypothetical protein
VSQAVDSNPRASYLLAPHQPNLMKVMLAPLDLRLHREQVCVSFSVES